jgi:hypothetical protein
MHFGQTMLRHSSHVLAQTIHVLFPQTLHWPLTSSSLIIDPQDSQQTSIQSLFQSLDKAGGTKHFTIQQNQALVAAELSATHAFAPKILQGDGMAAVCTDESKVHWITQLTKNHVVQLFFF